MALLSPLMSAKAVLPLNPAKAGIQLFLRSYRKVWIPAFAAMRGGGRAPRWPRTIVQARFSEG